MVTPYRHLLVLRVAVDADELHAVQERAGDGVGHVGRGDEQHLGQVQVDLQVVVAEGVVLRRVEHLQQGRRRVPPPVGTQLVDLVQHEDRVHRPRLGQGARDAPGLRAHVGAPVTADLGLVPGATQGDAGERAAQRPRHRLPQGGLSHARGTDQGQDHPRAPASGGGQAAVRPALAHGEVLDDPLLHVGEPGVIGVERAPGLPQVEVVLRARPPRQLEDGVEPGADPAMLGALLARALQPGDLALDGLASRVRHLQPAQAAAVLLDGVRGLVGLAQLLADGGQLLAQQEVALRALHALRDLVADPLPQGQVCEHVAHPAQEPLEPGLHLDGLQQLDLLLEGQVGRVAGEVGQGARVGDGPQGLGDLARPAVLEHVLHHRSDLTGQLQGTLAGIGVPHRLHLHPKGRPGAGKAHADAGAAHAPHDGRGHAARKLAGLFDLRNGPDRRVPSPDPGDQHHPAVTTVPGLHRGARLGRLQGHAHGHPREDDSGVGRHQRQRGVCHIRHWTSLLRTVEKRFRAAACSLLRDLRTGGDSVGRRRRRQCGSEVILCRSTSR